MQKTNTALEQAEINLSALGANSYPGRVIIIGMDENGENYVVAYSITGRSSNSRNRIFEIDKDGRLKTALSDPSKESDTSLIIYTAMDEYNGRHVVSNGHQTSDILTNELNWNFEKKLEKWIYEPDSPNFTPRITAIIEKDKPMKAKISILKKSPLDIMCDRSMYELNLDKGFGFCVSTYAGDGNPLPSFQGDPYLLPLVGDIEQIANTIWDNLNEDNRVALAVKFIPLDNGRPTIKVINKYKAIG